MARDTFELALDSTDFPMIRRVVRETLAPLGLSARFAGMPAIVTEQEATLVRIRALRCADSRDRGDVDGGRARSSGHLAVSTSQHRLHARLIAERRDV
jgi:hypothetical protein